MKNVEKLGQVTSSVAEIVYFWKCQTCCWASLLWLQLTFNCVWNSEWEDNVRMLPGGLDAFGSGYGSVTDSYEHDDRHSIKGREFLN